MQVLMRNETQARNKNGTFAKGISYSLDTQFKQGQHWRKPKRFWEYNYLFTEYILNKKSTGDIAKENNCTESNILFWLKKNKINRRDRKSIREVKNWGAKGELNAMFGRKGKDAPNWKGGGSPDRQTFYSSQEWKIVSKRIWVKFGTCCKRCSKKGGRINTKNEKGRYQIHHLVSFSIKELRAEEQNLIVLCKKCHNWVHSKQNINKEFILTKQQYGDLLNA